MTSASIRPRAADHDRLLCDRGLVGAGADAGEAEGAAEPAHPRRPRRGRTLQSLGRRQRARA